MAFTDIPASLVTSSGYEEWLVRTPVHGGSRLHNKRIRIAILVVNGPSVSVDSSALRALLGLPACLPACLLACLLACRIACLHALLGCLLIWLNRRGLRWRLML